MSMAAALLPATSLPPLRRLEGQVAVLAAAVLARWKPERIRALLVRLSAAQRPATCLEAEEAWTTVVGASRRCAGRRACLVRSLAVVLVCRRHGSWATWCVGVRASGLPGAHAWVEAEGEPVREPPGTALAYSTIVSVEARRGEP